jgi:hypothetical protein
VINTRPDFIITANLGDTVPLRIPVVRSGAAVDVTGATFVLECTLWRHSEVLISITDTLIDTPSTGIVIMEIPPTEFEQFTESVLLHCAIIMTELGGKVTTVADGILNMR